MSIENKDMPPSPVLRHEGAVLKIEWPNGRPEWTAITPEALESFVDTVNALREGASLEPLDEAVMPTPGQWINRWNNLTGEERLELVAHMQRNSDAASRCFWNDHEKYIKYLERRIGKDRTGLVVSDDGNTINWLGQNYYVRVTPNEQ